MIDKLINKYGTILNTLRENKSTKSDTDLYDYNNDIKNTREYLKDLKALKQQLTIPVVVGTLPCDECEDGEVWSPYYTKYVECDCRK
tara:strand:- start:13 stop:273 length:261 start_codon:yes stop_codon:yes gene_type:complete